MPKVNLVRRDEIIIELDKERRIKYTLGSLAELEKRFGSLNAALEQCQENIENIIYLVWLGLKWEDKDLTEDQVADLIDVTMIQTLMNECIQPALNMDVKLPEDHKKSLKKGKDTKETKK